MKEFKKVFIDTNVFLRLVDQTDKEVYEQAYNVVDLVKRGKLDGFTSNLVISEIHWVLNSFYDFERYEILDVIRSILNLKNLKFIDSYDPSIFLDLAIEYNIKLVDCQIASIKEIQSGELTVVSFDKEFAKIKGIRHAFPEKILKKHKN